MIQSLTLKLSYMQVETLAYIIWNISSVLMTSGNNLYRISGIVLNDLHHRLDKKMETEYKGLRTVKLNLKECLALKQFLLEITPQENPYATVIRNEVFQFIDQKI